MVRKLILRNRLLRFWQSFWNKWRKSDKTAEYLNANIQLKIFHKTFFQTPLNNFLAALRTCRKYFSKVQNSYAEGPKLATKHSFKTIRFPQEIPWTRSKQFWALCRKWFAQGLKLIVNWKFFQTILVQKIYNPWHVERNFSNRAAKLSRKSEVFFRYSPEHILEVIKSRLSLKMFLWNHGLLFWQYQQKFPPKIDFFSWMIKKKNKLKTFLKSFVEKVLWMSWKHFWNCAENVSQRSKFSLLEVQK